MKARVFLHFFAIATFALAAVVAITPLVRKTDAQTSAPVILITWQATDSYAPPDYAGKILPNQESQVAASLEVIANGRPVDLSGKTIYWYQNGDSLGGGIGAQHFVFHPYGQAPNTIALEVQLPDYPTGLLIHTISIPIVQPVAIIDAPYPGGNFAASPIVAQALPYFFATTSTSPLTFAWAVNGQTVASAENPQTLQVSLPQSTPSGFPVAVNLTIQNSNDSVSANGTANLTYQPKP